MSQESSPPAGRLMAMGASLGLLYGLFEGTESFFLSLYPQGRSWQTGNSAEALLFMPAFYVIVYLGVSLTVVALSRVIRRPWWDFVLMAVLGTLSGYLAFRNQGRVFSEITCVILGLGIGSVTIRLYRKYRAAWSGSLVRSVPVIGGVAALIGGGAHFTPRLLEARHLAGLPAPPEKAPNVLLLVIDTQRADHLSSYGYSRRTTPHIDSLAARGTLFEQAFASSSWTLPSHASMFTGRLVHEHLAGDGAKQRLGTEYRTLAEALSARGFATAGFIGNIFWTGRHTGLARGFEHYEDYYGTLGDAVARTTLGRRLAPVREALGWVDIPGRKRAGDVNREFLTWLDRAGSRPFFAFLNYMDVHSPYIPIREYQGRFGYMRPEFRPTTLDIGAERHTVPAPAKLSYLIDRYDECLLYLDDQVGRLLAELGRRGVLEHTLVIVTSDHGEHFGEHNIIQHAASLYTQEIQVPLILWYPSAVPAGLRRKDPVGLANLAATVASLTGVPDSIFPGRSLLLPPDAAGRSPVPLLSELSKQGDKDPPEWPASKGWVKSLVEGQWHFIQLENGEQELFDLQTDPDERTNLAQTTQGAMPLAHMRDRFESLLPSPKVAASRSSSVGSGTR